MLEIKRRNDQQAVSPIRRCVLGEFDGLRKIRGAGRDNDVQAVAMLECDLGHLLALRHRKRRVFPGSPEYDNAVDAGLLEVSHHVGIDAFVKLQILVARGQGCDPEHALVTWGWTARRTTHSICWLAHRAADNA